MFGPIRPTAYDVEFRLFGVPIRVLPWFWLMAAFLGMGYLRAGPLYLAIWMTVVFVSILVHELGHALTAEAFGCPSSIILFHFGGLAMHHPGVRYTRPRRMAIILAGPLAGLALFGLVLLLLIADSQLRFLPAAWWESDVFHATIDALIFVNLVWSLFNLLPVYPLDGGQLTRELCMHFNRIRGDRIAAFISMSVGAVAAVILAAYFRQPYAALMLGFMAFQSYQELQER